MLDYKCIAQKSEWFKKFEGKNNYCVISNITTDKAQNVYTCGFFNGEFDFDPGPKTFSLKSTGWNSLFVTKFDSNGNFNWAKSIGGSKSCEPQKIIYHNDGLFLTGVFESTVDFNPRPDIFKYTSFGEIDIFRLNLDTEVSFNGQKKLGTRIDNSLWK